MDAVSFDTWLGAICLLTACQRQEGFMSLGLAEGDDEAASVRIDAPPMSVGGVCCAPDGTALATQITVESDAPPAPASASAAAQSRVESTGCPHCASQRFQRWGHASDLPRYRCTDCRRRHRQVGRHRDWLKPKWSDICCGCPLLATRFMPVIATPPSS